MSSEIILKVENIGKQYRLGLVGTGTISHDLNRWWNRIRGKEDPYLKVGEANSRNEKGNSDYVWALKDINFEVRKGEVLGIIGKNGAGKSTLLKILSRVTSPTVGEIKTKGRIASLLEVGTGFHPEMTGRENVYLNGAILGMTKAEIKDKIDEIIEFSGCLRFIDTPVKRYSSGMKVRLAFAVAAFLEPDILVVDEVLAVGDAEFQKKAIGKMQDVSTQSGRTVLFVSHDMAAVQNLCSRTVVIKNGGVNFIGETSDAISNYLSDDNRNSVQFHGRKGSGIVAIEDIEVVSENFGNNIQTGSPVQFIFKLKNRDKVKRKDIRFDFRIDDEKGQRITWLSDFVVSNKQSPDDIINSIVFNVKRFPLNKGIYYITTYLTVDRTVSDWIQNAYSFSVVGGDFYGTGKIPPINQGKTLLEYDVT
ncbi:ABC transporter ATP-binding protein [Winogradskyella sp.]|uniref:ABC transporter ATP-binding protein n=1 Tax=Winogradskyella sp. TaxID=1883156 RepID=UPI003AB8BA5C